MKVFISYSNEDTNLARSISNALTQKGLDVWEPSVEVLPGENWGEKVSRELNNSEAMVVLLTNAALDSKHVLLEIDHALGDESYNKRVFPIVVGSVEASNKKIPWILKRFNIIHLHDNKDINKVSKQISQALKQV